MRILAGCKIVFRCAGLLALGACASAQELRFAELGDLPLAGGQTLKACRVGYRTYGTLAPDRSNAILFPTWFGGTSQDLERYIGPGRLLDSSRWFVVAVDALGNGVSTSPSTSAAQPRMAFPALTLGDLVESQRRLLTGTLGLTHVRAVVGISMGGMQAFQWMVAHPGFMDVAAPLMASPRLDAYDAVLWRTYSLAITRDAGWMQGNYRENPAKELRRALWQLLGSTPDKVNRESSRTQEFGILDAARTEPAADANDQLRQAEAMLAHDVGAAFGGSLDRAAAAVRCRALVVVGRSDHTVTPHAALAFAKRAGARLLVLDNDCGHGALGCDLERVRAALAELLGP